jgi:hypothetical protein
MPPHQDLRPSVPTASSSWARRIVIASLSVFLAACLAIFAAGTWRWPLVGDASVIHYVAFLMDHGFVPYRQIHELNMPGAYLVEWLLIHTFGGGSLSWRIFDFTLSAAIASAMIILARPYSCFAGFAAAALLTLIHGQDGVAFLGERDLIIAALLAWTCAFLFLGLRHNAAWLIFAAGFAAGVAATMKPLAIPAGFLLPPLLAFRLKSQHRPRARFVLYAAAGFLFPCLTVCFYLVRVHAMSAFIANMFGLSRYYNGLYRKPPLFLLLHSVAPLGPLVLLWLVVIALHREWNWEKKTLAGAAIVGLAFYLLQPRGFPYYRYPLLVFLLTLMAIDFMAVLCHPVLRYLAAVAGIYAVLILAPQCTFKALRYDWRNQEFVTMLNNDLSDLGGQQLSGKVQCLDTIAGCINTLYRAQLVQATGFFYDCYAYAPRGTEMMWMVDRYRRAFLEALRRNPPKVLIVSNQYCQEGPDSYDKLRRWPEMQALIAGQYRLYADRMPPDDVYWWSRPLKPSGYRIYLKK